MLRSINDYCPDGMQISSPGGVTIDRDKIAGMESYCYPEDPRLVILYAGGAQTTVRFHRNVNGGPADVYGLAANIREDKRVRVR